MRVRVASAGTGKTTSLVQRYLELIEDGRPLRRIAGVTFTRAAADELRQRVGAGLTEVLERGSYLGGLFTPTGDLAPFRTARRELDGAVLSTIHGFMIAALRLSAPVLGLDPSFAVVGEWEAAAMFEEEVRSLRLLAADETHPLHGAAALLGEDAGPWLLALFGKRSLAGRLEPGDGARGRALVELYEAVYARFEARLGAVLLGPGEVERRALRLLEVPQARARLASRFPVALIDEFQDVNPLQGRFFERLEASGVRVEVVGDPKQSIYGFRNADVEVFRRALDAAEATGEVAAPLTETRRHARALTAFLNRVTDGLAERELGFGPREAPPVRAAGAQAAVAGSVALHWVVGDAPIGRLRAQEARVLAAALRRAHREDGIGYGEMAVLARAYGGLAVAEQALRHEGIPCIMVQGRGYYVRSEIRDLVHALHVGIEPAGLSLAAFLRGPFGQLPLAEVDAVLRASDPVGALRKGRPSVARRVEEMGRLSRLPPLEALKRLMRDPLVDGRRYVEFLDMRARENVDALLFELAAQPPGDLEVLLDRLELLSAQAEAGDVPQSGDGVQLLTVHRSKGLEFRLAAVFDAGRMPYARFEPLYLDAEAGKPYVAGSEGYDAAREAALARDEQESYRLLYVAASRARDALVVTGSVKQGRAEGWAAALSALGFGPAAPGSVADADGARIVTVAFDDAPDAAAAPSGSEPVVLEAAPWTERVWARPRHPPVTSPSRAKGAAAPERLSASDPDAEGALPGRALAIGTLVHYAVGQDWTADDPLHMANLAAQEVMFPFSPEERDEVLGEVGALLRAYRAMLGRELPLLEMRERDRAELPVVLRVGDTVWQGVIDRLYRVRGAWVVEDYKTDRSVVPERYAFQLAFYVRAVEEALGARPTARLVYLRRREVVTLDDMALRRAFEEEA